MGIGRGGESPHHRPSRMGIWMARAMKAPIKRVTRCDVRDLPY